ncbi:hypothetical protein LSCM1_03333 [Leishmania martiniquensis]|uniref:Uncharacterized protein n=1 Tax=Leishmania martiniquensis TaxID=1580590 RepID=A0A836KHN4_9TRYP|nr:hypothetical protein LSCM1_03333 [Leishmania martiniquensis]
MPHSSAKRFSNRAGALLGPSVKASGERAKPLTWLEAHAAVRLYTLTGKSFDCYGLPQRQSSKDGRARFSFIKCVKGLASQLTARVGSSFEECLIRVVESGNDLTFEVRQLSGGNCAREQLLFVAPLSTLLDVVSDSVIERDTVVFAHLPSSFQPAAEHSSYVVPVAASVRRRAPRTADTIRSTALRKKKIISTLFSAYGDIGLDLVFRAAQADAVNSRRSSSSLSSASHTAATGGGSAPYTRVRLRFVSTKERDAWLSFCAEAYVGLLLDSIRTGRDTVFVVDEGDHSSPAAAASPFAAVPRSDVVDIEKPTEEAVECYIDFFLAASAKGDVSGASNGGATSSSPRTDS